MPRAERIEYEGAYYHVMNRGRDGGRVNLFHSPEYYQAFLQTLQEAVDRFGIVLHAYCLMTNHYHLLIETPHANISRAMRHISGVYTQRHNRLAKSDGTIFRGRFKSILVDKDCYFLQLTRYIHRNPVETKKPMVEDLVDYPWSSYPAYLNRTNSPEWLERSQVYAMLGSKQQFAGYAKYVAQGNSEEITRFYNRGNIATVIGDKDFATWLKDEKMLEIKQKEWVKQVIPGGLTIDAITSETAAYYQQSVEQLKTLRKGRQSQSKARRIAIYLSQYLGDHRLKSIGDYFGLGHVGSVSHITCIIRQELNDNEQLDNEVRKLCELIINNAT